MIQSFGDQLVQLWEENKKRGESDTFWKTNEEAFRHRLLGLPAGLPGAAREMFGDLSTLLDWKIEPSFRGEFAARAAIPGYTTTLEWSPDITGLYVFHAWTKDPDGGVTRHHLDGRLKLGAILVEWGSEGQEDDDYESDGPLGVGGADE